MLYNITKVICFVSLCTQLLCSSPLKAEAEGNDEVVSLSTGAWQIAPQAEVALNGSALSSPEYRPNRWINAQVPGTVFGSYVNAGLENEPTYGDNITQVDKAKYDRNFWYRTEFITPSQYINGKTWLCFDGVNRDADIYVNGQSLGSLHGIMQRGRFDVTDLIRPGKRNSLAVLIYVPVLTNDGNGNSFSPSFLSSQGWDWMPRVPGLNMGIYKDVYLTHTGPVTLIDPWVRTDLSTASQANLSVQTSLKNYSSAPITGTLKGVISPGNISFTRSVTLQAGESTVVNLDSQTVAALRIKKPRLWWPNGYGEPNLYSCRLTFATGKTVSDSKEFSFGIRKYTYDTDGGVLHFHINGVRIFPKGGNWGMAEFMLRSHGNDYDTRVRLHKEMNFNMIRNWMGMTPDEAFYEACDRNGIMVWDDFWMSGNKSPADVDIFRSNAIEKVKQFRNHPSIALWCGSNEGVPPAPLNDWLKADTLLYDGGDRRYQPNSNAITLSGSGPWNNLSLKQYFQGVPRNGEGVYGMRSEIGTATVTSFDSLKKFIPRESWWPRDRIWQLHYLGQDAANAGPDQYNADIDSRYGEPGDIEDYCRKAQFLNQETMKAIFEGWLDHMDRDASGVLIWMSQSAFPSFVWQTYDYYYDLTGSYWGAKAACEPVHIYWNANDDRIRVVNTGNQNYANLTAEASIYNMDGTQKLHDSRTVSSRVGTVTDCFILRFPSDLSATHFLKLRLKDQSGRVVSENFYWRGNRYQDYTALNELKPVKLAVSSSLTRTGSTDLLSVQITNPVDSGTVAFGIRPKAIGSLTGQQILPAFMNDGYFALLPGASKKITIQFAHMDTPDIPKVEVECWNNAPKFRPVPETTNLAHGHEATASSIEPELNGRVPANVTDGSLSTRWASQSGVDPQWITVDLGESQKIDRIKLYWETAYAKSYQIQVSEDNSHWTEIYRTNSGRGGVDDLQNLHNQGRYVRMSGTERGTMYGYSLYEFKVFGPDTAPVSPN